VTGCRVAIMADLYGPKMRIGKIDPKPIQLQDEESRETSVCQGLFFSYDVYSVTFVDDLQNWSYFARQCFGEHKVADVIAMLVVIPDVRNPDANHRLEFLRVDQ
jgi:hypothetical protein